MSMQRRLGALVLSGLAFTMSASAQAADKTVLVALVASNAKASFGDVVAAYEKTHPNVSVQASYAGSKIIMAQVDQGAAADVIVVSSSAIGPAAGVESAQPIFKNHTAVVVAKAAAGKVHDAKDLGKPGVRVVAGVPGSVAAGFETETLAKLSGLYGKDFPAKYAENVVSKKTDNAHIFSTLTDGSGDAAILYAADADPAKSILIALPPEAQVSLAFSIAQVKASAHAAAAKEFASFVAGPDAAAIFKAHHHDAI